MAPARQSTTIAARAHLGQGWQVIELELPQLASQCAPAHFITLTRHHTPPEPPPPSSFPVALPVFGVSPLAGARAKRVQCLVPPDLAWLVAEAWKDQPVTLEVHGPLGNALQLAHPRSDATLFLAEGGACASLAFAALDLASSARSHPATFLVGGDNKRDMPWARALSFLADAGVTLMLSSLDGSLGTRGSVFAPYTSELEALQNRAQSAQVVAAGSQDFLQQAAHLAASHAASLTAVNHHHLLCGYGVCGACTLPDGQRACVDGPALAHGEV